MEHPAPEHQNWTWVLERRCEDCGSDVGAIDRDELAGVIRSNAAAWRSLLGREDLVRVRPPSSDGVVWSALEYGAHVRDVYELFADRLKLMLSEDEPTFTDWDQNQAALDGNYVEQDPGRVSYALAVGAGKFADMLDHVAGDQWARVGRRSDGDAFTVESIARYLLHDVSHHVWDVEQGYEALTEDD